MSGARNNDEPAMSSSLAPEPLPAEVEAWSRALEERLPPDHPRLKSSGKKKLVKKLMRDNPGVSLADLNAAFAAGRQIPLDIGDAQRAMIRSMQLHAEPAATAEAEPIGWDFTSPSGRRVPAVSKEGILARGRGGPPLPPLPQRPPHDRSLQRVLDAYTGDRHKKPRPRGGSQSSSPAARGRFRRAVMLGLRSPRARARSQRGRVLAGVFPGRRRRF